jgi:hypothetical protein
MSPSRRETYERQTGQQKNANLKARLLLSIGAFIALATALAACGSVSKRIKTEPVPLTALNRCLERHGVPDPEKTQTPTPQELAIPSLLAVRGVRVPVSVNRATFKEALAKCDAGSLQVAPSPITDKRLQNRINAMRVCLARNGYILPPPNYPGPGPVLDTSMVDIASARWVATATGCGVTKELTPAALEVCMGKNALSGGAKTNVAFQRKYLQLAGCLKTKA